MPKKRAPYGGHPQVGWWRKLLLQYFHAGIVLMSLEKTEVREFSACLSCCSGFLLSHVHRLTVDKFPCGSSVLFQRGLWRPTLLTLTRARQRTCMKVLGMVMAGGRGSRLRRLTNLRSKPAVPFGGKYRIIDFVLSNFINSGVHSIYVLTQFKAQALLQHLRDGWNFGELLKEKFIIPVPAQMNIGDRWYLATADAIFQNLNLIERSRPDLVAVFAADHIYKMDLRQMFRSTMKLGLKGPWPQCPCPWPTQLSSVRSKSTTVGASRVSTQKSHCPRKFQTDPAGCWLRWGTTSSTPDSSAMHCARMRRRKAPNTISEPTSSRSLSARTGSSHTTFTPTACLGKLSRPLDTGAMWAQSMLITRPTWTSGLQFRAWICTTKNGRCILRIPPHPEH